MTSIFENIGLSVVVVVGLLVASYVVTSNPTTKQTAQQLSRINSVLHNASR